MPDNTRIVDWGGLTLRVNKVEVGTTDAGKADGSVLEMSSGGDLTVPGSVISGTGNGTVTTAATTTAVEYGDEINHTTKLTLADFAVGTSGDNASLAIGASLYTFPAGEILVENVSVVGAITADISVTTDTPEFGLGTTVGSGANATLGAVDAAAENVAGPFVATNVAGDTATDGGVSVPGLYI
ncbi:MAG: hypothetical protein KDA17_07215, partial [Candidatus Saccharibacteria bacterium]|nr:hypothetical protein [Candidatus Saccharibacteria bacterium]